MSLNATLRSYGSRTRMLIEIKSRKWDQECGRSDKLTHRVMAAIPESIPKGYTENIFILSFDPSVLVLAQKLEPNLRYILNFTHPVLPNTLNLKDSDRLFGVCIPIKELEKSFTGKWHDKGKLVATYGCNASPQVSKALSLGADIIMTDKPAWLFNFLRMIDFIV